MEDSVSATVSYPIEFVTPAQLKGCAEFRCSRRFRCRWNESGARLAMFKRPTPIRGPIGAPATVWIRSTALPDQHPGEEHQISDLGRRWSGSPVDPTTMYR